jgi:hypothetical protein
MTFKFTENEYLRHHSKDCPRLEFFDPLVALPLLHILCVYPIAGELAVSEGHFCPA